MKNKRILTPKKIIGVGVLIASAALITVLLLPKSDVKDEILWREYKAETGKISASFDGTGTLSLEEEAYSPPVDLVIDKVFVKMGQEVMKGDNLISYSKEKLQKQLEETEESLAKARRALEDAKNNITEKQLQSKSSGNEAEQSADKLYQSQKKEIERTITTLERDIRRATEKRESLLRQIRDAESSEDGTVSASPEIKRLSDEKKKLEDKLKQLENSAKEYDDTDAMRKYQTQKKELENAISSLERDIKKSEEKIATQTQKIRTAENSKNGSDTTSQEIQNLLDEKSKLDDELKRLQQNMKDNSNWTNIAALEQQRTTIQNQYNDLETQIVGTPVDDPGLPALQTQLRGLAQQIESLNSQIYALSSSSSYESGIADLQNRLAKLQEDINQATTKQNTLNNNQKTIESLNTELDQLKATLESLKDQLSDKQDKLKDLQSEYSEQAANDKLDKQQQDKIDDMKDQIKQITDMTETLITKQKTLESLHKELEQLDDTLETHNDGLLDAQAKSRDLQTDHGTQMSQINQNQATQNQINGLAMITLEHAVENAQSEVDKLEKTLSELLEIIKISTVTAKSDGVITSVNYNEGSEVKAGQSILSIGVHGDNYVKVQMPQGEINKVAINQQVELSFSAYPDSVFMGTVVGKNSTPTQGQDGVVYEVLVKLDKTDSELLNGMTCTTKFIIKRVEGVLTLSNKAIRIQNGKQVVTVRLPDGTTEERTITTGFSDGRISEITSGLDAGDTVVVEG